jgi:hypothetical protein
MGKTRGPYCEEFSVGIEVQIADRRRLEQFVRSWTLHHPLEPSQLAFAGARAVVKSVSFYHGGDELYVLEGLPGIWHEACLDRTGAG